jgi:hypothetical protein
MFMLSLCSLKQLLKQYHSEPPGLQERQSAKQKPEEIKNEQRDDNQQSQPNGKAKTSKELLLCKSTVKSE